MNAKSTNGLTALQQAAAEGHTEAADLLLSAGAAVDACALSNATALYNAANGGHLAIIERLLRAGADVDAKTSSGSTPLHAAASGGHTEASPLSVRVMRFSYGDQHCAVQASSLQHAV